MALSFRDGRARVESEVLGGLPPIVKGPVTLISSAWHDFGADWRAFSERHGRWLERVGSDPLYSRPDRPSKPLPPPVRVGQPLLSEEDAAAELDLLAFCSRHESGGDFAGKPVRSRLLTGPIPKPSLEAFLATGFTRADYEILDRQLDFHQSIHVRLKGYAGWLATEPAFCGAVRALEARWRQLPVPERPDFPLCRSQPVPTPPDTTDPPSSSGALAAFAQDYDAFCDHWGLIGMTTWDVPDPQGPLLPSPLPPGSAALPRHGLHLIVPLHYAGRLRDFR